MWRRENWIKTSNSKVCREWVRRQLTNFIWMKLKSNFHSDKIVIFPSEWAFCLIRRNCGIFAVVKDFHWCPEAFSFSSFYYTFTWVLGRINRSSQVSSALSSTLRVGKHVRKHQINYLCRTPSNFLSRNVEKLKICWAEKKQSLFSWPRTKIRKVWKELLLKS